MEELPSWGAFRVITRESERSTSECDRAEQAEGRHGRLHPLTAEKKALAPTEKQTSERAGKQFEILTMKCSYMPKWQVLGVVVVVETDTFPTFLYVIYLNTSIHWTLFESWKWRRCHATSSDKRFEPWVSGVGWLLWTEPLVAAHMWALGLSAVRRTELLPGGLQSCFCSVEHLSDNYANMGFVNSILIVLLFAKEMRPSPFYLSITPWCSRFM